MQSMGAFAAKHPGIFVLSLAFICLVLVLLLMGIAYSELRKPYGDFTAVMLRLAAVASRQAGRVRHHPVGLLASLAACRRGMLCFAGAGLCAFYSKVAFDVSSPIRLPAARTIVLTSIVYVLHKEILFR